MTNLQAVQFTQDLDKILGALKKEKYYKEYFPLLIVMANYNYKRDPTELLGIICEYPGLDDENTLNEQIEKCIQEGYLELKKISCDYKQCYMSEDGLKKFLSEIDVKIADEIIRCRENFLKTRCVHDFGLLVGGPSDGEANKSFIDRIMTAKKEILLPMFNTDAHPNTIKALLHSASKGVRVKILLANYEKVAKKIRGGSGSSIPDWVHKCGENKNIEIRVYSEIEDSILSSCVVFDRNITRVCVCDPLREKTSYGTLIECNKTGYDLNITKLVCKEFDEIWNRAKPAGKEERRKEIVRTLVRTPLFWLFWALLGTSFANLYVDLDKGGLACLVISNLFPIVFGAFLSEMVRFIKQISPKIRRWLVNWLQKKDKAS